MSFAAMKIGWHGSGEMLKIPLNMTRLTAVSVVVTVSLVIFCLNQKTEFTFAWFQYGHGIHCLELSKLVLPYFLDA